jgi:hypothetical protein
MLRSKLAICELDWVELDYEIGFRTGFSRPGQKN